MKCPLLTLGSYAASNVETWQERDCFKEECAWWDGHGGMCSVLKITRHLEAISCSLSDIHDDHVRGLD